MVDVDDTKEWCSAKWQSYKYEGLARLRVDLLKGAKVGGWLVAESGEGTGRSAGKGGVWVVGV